MPATAADPALLAAFPHPWCHALLTSPLYTHLPNPSTALSPTSSEHSLMGRTLHTAATVPHTAHLRRRATGDDARAETVLLVALGRGLNSHADILHGGIQAVLLDEVTGLFVLEALGLAKGAGSGIFTGGASLRFRAPVRTPGVYLLRACAVDEGWGRGGRWEVKAVLEDGAGRVLTEGWSVYVRAKGKL